MSVRELFELKGKVALVTGGSRGLGLQMAEALGEMGAKVAISARKADELAAAKKQLDAKRIETFTVVNDLAKPEEAAKLADAVMAHYGAIDILVNNAGTSWGAPAESHPLEAWNKVLGLNLTAPFLLSQAVANKSFIPRKRGCIVNIASIAGLRAGEGMQTAAYYASKAGLVNLTRALASEWGRFGVRVNAICPGFFPTKMTAGILPKIEKEVIAATPLHRLGDDEDLMGAVVYLASEASRHVTGQYIVVDGGVTAV